MVSGNLDFFAAEQDQKALMDFLFSFTDVRVFESYSEFDQDLREFHSTDELDAVFTLGNDPFGNGAAVLLQLWSPSVMSEVKIKRFEVNPVACDGHTYRHSIEGGALMQLYFGGIYESIVTQSHFGHQSQKRAQKCNLRGQACNIDIGVIETEHGTKT